MDIKECSHGDSERTEYGWGYCPICSHERCEKLEGALHQILQWAEAYPTSIFHEPTKEECHKAHELLKAHGMTLDAFSASMGRRCLKGVGDIARKALSTGA